MKLKSLMIYFFSLFFVFYADIAFAENNKETLKEAIERYDEEEYEEAFSLFKKIDQDPEAQFYIGKMYDAGEGVTQNPIEAAKWFRKSAEQGNPDAQFSLGDMYYGGEEVPQDYAEAAKWWRKSAEQGNADAQFNLGLMYEEGQGIPQDYTEAAKWYCKSAEQGDASAQYYLGLMYYDGEGITQDYFKAVKWFRKSAEQGNTEAQLRISDMYLIGEGVSKDYKEAVLWFRKSAEQGDESAQLNSLENELKDITSGDFEEEYDQENEKKVYPKKYATVVKYDRDHNYQPLDGDEWTDRKLQTKGWEWASDFDYMDKMSTSYPISLDYYVSKSHPDLRIIQEAHYEDKKLTNRMGYSSSSRTVGAAYDNDGKLIRILEIDKNSYPIEYYKQQHWGKYIIDAYNNNKYNILSEPKDVQQTLRLKLGLEKDKPDDGKEFVTKMTKLNRQYMSTSNKKTRKKLANQGFNIVMSALIQQESQNQRWKNPTALRWINQIEQDCMNEINSVWKINRIDDLTFKVFFLNKDKDKVTETKLVFSSNKPFGEISIQSYEPKSYQLNESSLSNN